MVPQTIKIGGVTYDVEIAEHRNNENGDILMGEVTYTDAKIYLNQNMKDEVIQQTLLHEIIHVVMHMMGRKDLNEDEYFVDALSLNLYQIFKDNDWITLK